MNADPDIDAFNAREIFEFDRMIAELTSKARIKEHCRQVRISESRHRAKVRRFLTKLR